MLTTIIVWSACAVLNLILLKTSEGDVYGKEFVMSILTAPAFLLFTILTNWNKKLF